MPGSLAQGPLACTIFCEAVFRWWSKGCSGAFSARSCRQGVRGWARCCLECECSRGQCDLESGEEGAISRPCPPTSSRGSEDPLRVRGRSHSLQGWRPAGTRREERLAYVFSCAFSSPPLREGRQRVRLFGNTSAIGDRTVTAQVLMSSWNRMDWRGQGIICLSGISTQRSHMGERSLTFDATSPRPDLLTKGLYRRVTSASRIPLSGRWIAGKDPTPQLPVDGCIRTWADPCL